jgi:anti-sigma factor ChrR (cupin superfamily)
MEEPVASQRSCLMKVDVGAFSPMQAHEELEQIYILEGSFLDANGVARSGRTKVMATHIFIQQMNRGSSI